MYMEGPAREGVSMERAAAAASAACALQNT
jgi:hypothetical protein